MSENLKTALIGAGASIVVAALTAYASVYVGIGNQSNRVADLGTEIRALEDRADIIDRQVNVPVGTVVASMFDVEKFRRVVGDPETFNLEKSRWTLADGKPVPGTKYAAMTENAPIPDLRGVFLRGNNMGRFKGVRTALGGYSRDQVGSHKHILKYHPYRMRNEDSRWNEGEGLFLTGPHNRNYEVELNHPNAETLPKNVVVNYYIKIN